MRKKEVFIAIFTVLLLLIIPISPKASGNELKNRDGVMQFLEEAFHQQTSLSEKVRSMEEINEVLTPYFSKEYQKKFLDANLYAEDGKYCTYGTDFAQYFIPYRRFTENTEVVMESKQIYVFEYFKKNHEGPVGYDDHYEGILIEKVKNEWKVTDYLYNHIPRRIIDKAEQMKKDSTKVGYQEKEENSTFHTKDQSLITLSAILPKKINFSVHSDNPFYSFLFKRKINHRFSLLF
ncbi:DUF3993 domain-containing protein [Neobacillus sp. D3-1R]|uniref:DUF3993 domain-containing protein n=1 Tax=Neobacillus sp. D3-1R TaxID=3445778 RepID=UPI003F9FBED2